MDASERAEGRQSRETGEELSHTRLVTSDLVWTEARSAGERANGDNTHSLREDLNHDFVLVLVDVELCSRSDTRERDTNESALLCTRGRRTTEALTSPTVCVGDNLVPSVHVDGQFLLTVTD